MFQLSSLVSFISIVFLAFQVTCRPIEKGSFNLLHKRNPVDSLPFSDESLEFQTFLEPNPIDLDETGLAFLDDDNSPLTLSDPSSFLIADAPLYPPRRTETPACLEGFSGSENSDSGAVCSLRTLFPGGALTDDQPGRDPPGAFDLPDLFKNPSEMVPNNSPTTVPNDSPGKPLDNPPATPPNNPTESFFDNQPITDANIYSRRWIPNKA